MHNPCPFRYSLVIVCDVRCTDITGTVLSLTSGAEMVMPGDNTTLAIELLEPVAMHSGMRFAIREGGRTVGAGVISKLLD